MVLRKKYLSVSYPNRAKTGVKELGQETSHHSPAEDGTQRTGKFYLNLDFKVTELKSK